MTYEEIIQQPGKMIEAVVYYKKRNEQTYHQVNLDNFESAIKSLEVVVGPRDDKCAKIKALLSMYGLNSVNESTASLIFKKEYEDE